MKTETASEGFFNDYTMGMVHAGLIVTAGLVASLGVMKLVF